MLGVTKPISSVPLCCHFFQIYQNIGYLLNIIFIFDRCHRSWATVTSVKHGCDIKIQACCFIRSIFSLAEKLINRALVTPTPNRGAPWLVPKCSNTIHHYVIKWNHFPRYWPFVREPTGDHWQRLVTELWCLMCAWKNGWANSLDAGDLRHHDSRCDVTLMPIMELWQPSWPAGLSLVGLTLWPNWLERWPATLNVLSTQVQIPAGMLQNITSS